MAIRKQHEITDSTWFVTFTCFSWIPLFEITKSYDLVYNWINLINDKYKIKTVAFVIMPNHVHMLLYLTDDAINLNKVISNGKRFMAYALIERLKETNNRSLLNTLALACSEKEKAKGQLHKAFEPSFDAKVISSIKFLNQKMDYIHHNPVMGKWRLCEDFTDYEHSSAAFYELTGSIRLQVLRIIGIIGISLRRRVLYRETLRGHPRWLQETFPFFNKDFFYIYSFFNYMQNPVVTMKHFYLSIILISFCSISNGQQKNKTSLPTGEVLSLYKTHSVAKVFRYLKKHNFRETSKNVTGARSFLSHNYHYEKGDLAFWVSVTEKQSYDLSYYPTSPAKTSGVIADLVALRYKLVHSKTHEDDVVKSNYSSYAKDGVFVEVDSFYNKIQKAATHSVIISDHTYM